MTAFPIDKLSEYIEDNLIEMIGKSGSVKFVKYVSPGLIVDAQKFFKTFIPFAKYYVVIVPADINNDKVKDELISMAKSSFNFTILYSYKLKDRLLIVGYE
ncbi:DUF4898 domain-containing protein [Saccharolobus solfataricus]|uniref:DUF4898 domain-containing protein n=3 Tax=Saccharolobus solfataricus TaxID=2287 RepID=Q97X48_SACS2|nr:DUF4898 domain-containing protein [Saccharolobus solfataricus]AAK42100.1 Hypothetical protein SSO1908 [Saccharolobus solfataricus P2]AKA74799.1 DUF4898 domain-containing protein [Saccharolobus solfataricus]AKA77495.1 DUF4898 domain-containing protein [Saccharolobus solfataricus]AKA80185.1 DUF4898 domain-containing protein [Saccharolobus solfataricus]AZF69267.1 DUF4898 domain-containing protein [Saccharolobus solfataricus]